MRYYFIALGIWVVVSILLARNEKIWRRFFGELSYGKEDEETIEEMKEVAQKVFNSQKISAEQAKKYNIMTVDIDERAEEIIVESNKARVSISKERIKVEHAVRTKLEVTFGVFVYFFILGIFAISSIFMLWQKYVG